MSSLIHPDPTRRIHIEGAGEVERPVEVSKDVSGLDLVSMRSYRFRAGHVINGDAESDEVCVVLLFGSAFMEVGRTAEMRTGAEPRHRWLLHGRGDVFAGAPDAVYLPPEYSYRLTMREDSDVAYSRGRAVGRFDPKHVRPTESSFEAAEGGAVSLTILGPDEAESLQCYETVLSGGARFDVEASTDTVLHFRLDPAGSNARVELSSPLGSANGEAERFEVGDADSVAVTGKRCVVTTEPGAILYLLRVSGSSSGG